MNNLNNKKKAAKQPMATRNAIALNLDSDLNDYWVDRLIVSMYVVLTGTLFSISLALLLGFNF
jgi:hypothetical protein|tara:strand:- start:2357 stop:2545 length:189 start_codon:yes stop_codon:yes gene_type:complete